MPKVVFFTPTGPVITTKLVFRARSMIHTPVKMVRTRSAARSERERGVKQDGAEQFTPKTDNFATSAAIESTSKTVSEEKTCTNVPANSVKSEIPPPALPASSVKSGKSSVTSYEARRRRLEMQAAKEKAKIRMELIDKQLELDIAELDDEEYSPQDEKTNERNVEQWLESSYKALENIGTDQRASSPLRCIAPPAATTRPVFTAAPAVAERPIAAAQAPATSAAPHLLAQAPASQPTHASPYGNPDATVQMLASTVKDLAAVCATSGNNANLLSRLSTPRDLPEFCGDPMEWLQFKQAYDESTEVCGFSAKENLWRLRKCLRGAAKDTVSAMLISATSPDIIISTLQLRFGNPDGIVSRILHDIKRLPPVSHEYQKDIVIFSCKIRNYIEAIRAVNRAEYLEGMSIFSIILSKLPTVLYAKWTDYSFPIITENKKSRLSVLSDFLHDEAVKVSTTATTPEIYGTSLRSDNRYQKHEQHKPQTVLLQTGPSASDNTCDFCHAEKIHKLTDCKQFKRALRKVKWQYVKRKGICYKCLLSRHARETCPAPVCDKDNCGAAHHRLLHFQTSQDARGDRDASEQHRTDNVQSVETVTI